MAYPATAVPPFAVFFSMMSRATAGMVYNQVMKVAMTVLILVGMFIAIISLSLAGLLIFGGSRGGALVYLVLFFASITFSFVAYIVMVMSKKS